MFKLSIRLCLAITLVVCLSVTANAMPNTATYAQDAIVPEEELSQIDAADLSHLTGGPVAATPGYDPKAVFKTLLNPKTFKTLNQLHAILEDPSFPGRVSERILVKLTGANPGPAKLKEIKLYTQMRITNIVLSLYYAQDIASAKSSAKGETVLVQWSWEDIGEAIVAGAEVVGTAVTAVGAAVVEPIPGLDVLADAAVAEEATGTAATIAADTAVDGLSDVATDGSSSVISDVSDVDSNLATDGSEGGVRAGRDLATKNVR